MGANASTIILIGVEYGGLGKALIKMNALKPRRTDQASMKYLDFINFGFT